MMNRKLMYTALSASLLLAACGTDSNDDKTDASGVEDPAETVNTDTEGTDTSTDSGSTEQSDSSESADDSSSEGSETDGSDSAGEGTDSEEENGEAGDDTSASLPDSSEVKSDGQDFKMQVLDGYTLTSEEPGRDVLYVKDDDTYFMTIGTSDSADTDYDKALENLNETLAASSSDASPSELTEGSQLPESGGLEKLKAYRVLAAEGPVTGLIFERGDMLVKVMIYDNNDEAYYDDFLKMAETIVSAK